MDGFGSSGGGIGAAAKARRNRALLSGFGQPLESIYLHHHFVETLVPARLSMALGILLYSAFGVVDYWVFPTGYHTVWMIRYVVVLPVGLLALIGTFFARRDRHVQLAFSLVMLAAGGGISVMMALDASDSSRIYLAGILLVIFYAYVFATLRFWYALAVALVLSLSHFLTDIFWLHVDTTEIIVDVFFLGTANVIGLFGSYVVETFTRRTYLQSRTITRERRELEAANAELRRLSSQDDLTGLPNRRSFFEAYDREWRRCMREERPIAIVMIDVDRFKDYNDKYGHQTGDRCLRKVAECLRHAVGRPGDLVARYGGEEFVILLADTDTSEARRIGEAMRSDVERSTPYASEPDGTGGLTISVGVASAIPDGGNGDELLAGADRALYEAKNAGRNRVCVGPGSYFRKTEY